MSRPSLLPALPPPILFEAAHAVAEADERGSSADKAESSSSHGGTGPVASELVELTSPLLRMPGHGHFASYTYTITPPEEEEEDESIRILGGAEQEHEHEQEEEHKESTAHAPAPQQLSSDSRPLQHSSSDVRPAVDIYASRQLQQSVPERGGGGSRFGTGDSMASNCSTLTSSSTTSGGRRLFDSATNGEELRAQVQAAMAERARSKDLLQAREQAMLARLNRRKPASVSVSSAATATAAGVNNKENHSAAGLSALASLATGSSGNGDSSVHTRSGSSLAASRLEEMRAKMHLHSKPSHGGGGLHMMTGAHSSHQAPTPPLSPNSRLQNMAGAGAAAAQMRHHLHQRQNSFQ